MLFYGLLNAPIWMKLWPPDSHRRGGSAFNYLIDQLTSVKFTYKGCQKGHSYFLSTFKSTYGHLTVKNGFSPPNWLTVQLTSVKLDTLIRLTHRKVSLELIYHSYNYKHYQHIAYVNIFYGLLCTFSSGPLRFCQQNPFSSIYLSYSFETKLHRVRGFWLRTGRAIIFQRKSKSESHPIIKTVTRRMHCPNSSITS